MKFQIISDYKPAGDQPQAIKEICSALNGGIDAVTLLGVTGSGKTYALHGLLMQMIMKPVDYQLYLFSNICDLVMLMP